MYYLAALSCNRAQIAKHYKNARNGNWITTRVLRTNKRYPLEKYIHLIISPVR